MEIFGMRAGRLLATATVAFAVAGGLAWVMVPRVLPDAPVDIHVRWKPDVTDAQRLELERRFRLGAGDFREGTTWSYQLGDTTTPNIRALIQDARVDDTAHLNRIRYRPEFAQDRERQRPAYAVGIGGIGSILALAFVLLRANRAR
jgi:hypothetical protein